MCKVLVQSLALCGVVLTTHALRFVALGDWGDDDGFQPEVAAALGTWANQRPLDFVLSLGDNFYPHGVTSVNDTQWDTKWKEMYLDKKSLQVPWYSMAGNHDHRGNLDAQIQYNQLEPLWIMPNLYYNFTMMAGDASVDLIVFDTHTIERDGTQQDWLRARVADSTADWLIVTAHAPIYSTGWHGMRWETYWVERELRPLLEENRAAFYISGHDHDLQHVTRNASSVEYIVSGGGHERRFMNPIARRQMEARGAALDFRASSLGFVELDIEGATASVRFINDEPEVLYQFTKSNPRAQQI